MAESQDNQSYSPKSDSSVPLVDARGTTPQHVRMDSGGGSECGSESIDLPTPPPFNEGVPSVSMPVMNTNAGLKTKNLSRSSSEAELKRPVPIVNPSSRLGERMRQSKLNNLFQLPSEEEHIDDWSAAHSKSILIQGRVYLFTHYICFFSKLFGEDSREVIKLSEVSQLSKKRNGIEVFIQGGERFYFTSFITRSKAFEAMLKAWKCSTMSSDSTDTSKQAESDKKSETCSVGSDDGIIVDMNDVEAGKEATSSKAHSVTSDIPLGATAETIGNPSISSNEGSSSEKPEAAKESKESKDGDSKSKGSDSDKQVSVRDGNLVYIWDPPPESTIHHDGVLMFETHHDHFDRVDLLQFFHLFYSDASGDFAENGHKALEEFDLVSEPWTEKEDGGKQRLLQFNSNLHGIPIGPSKTRMTELQWYSLNADTLIVHTLQNSLDVPYGDYFDVENTWEFSRSLKSGVDVSVKAGVHWKKKTWLKSQVESTTLKKCKECHIKWCGAIKEYMSFHMDQLGKRLVPCEVNEESSAKLPKTESSVIRRRKHKHKHHHKMESGEESAPVTPTPSTPSLSVDTSRAPVSPSVFSPTECSVNNNNGPRPKLLVKKERAFSSQHLVMMAIWLLTVIYLIARIMALEHDVERLTNAQTPPNNPPPPPPPAPSE